MPAAVETISHAMKAMIAWTLDATTFVFLPVNTAQIAARVMCADLIPKIKHSAGALNLV